MRAIKTAQLRGLFHKKNRKRVTHLSCYSEGSGVEIMRPAFMIFFVVLHTPAGNKCYYALGPILKRRSISQSIKIRLYKTIIRPVVVYGAET